MAALEGLPGARHSPVRVAPVPDSGPQLDFIFGSHNRYGGEIGSDETRQPHIRCEMSCPQEVRDPRPGT